jgi:hypothetical protein
MSNERRRIVVVMMRSILPDESDAFPPDGR